MKYDQNKYYYDGYAAQTNNCAYEECEIKLGTQSRLDWCQGWRDAEHDSRKKLPTPDSEKTNHQLESLAASQQPAWNGAGLPPVGCECEAFDGVSWFPVVIVGRFDGFAFAWNYDYRKTLTVNEEHSNNFRQIRTEAERRREEVADSLNKLLGDIEKYPTWKDALSGIYDLVAAGEVPHLKLEGGHE